MVLLDNIIVLVIATALVLVFQILSIKTTKRWIYSSISVVIELLAAVFLLFAGASLEELYLILLLFGAISLSVYYYVRPAPKNYSAESVKEEASNGI